MREFRDAVERNRQPGKIKERESDERNAKGFDDDGFAGAVLSLDLGGKLGDVDSGIVALQTQG